MSKRFQKPIKTGQSKDAVSSVSTKKQRLHCCQTVTTKPVLSPLGYTISKPTSSPIVPPHALSLPQISHLRHSISRTLTSLQRTKAIESRPISHTHLRIGSSVFLGRPICCAPITLLIPLSFAYLVLRSSSALYILDIQYLGAAFPRFYGRKAVARGSHSFPSQNVDLLIFPRKINIGTVSMKQARR